MITIDSPPPLSVRRPLSDFVWLPAAAAVPADLNALQYIHEDLFSMTPIVDLKSWKSTFPRKIAKSLHNISTLPIREAIIEE